ncbi:MAG: serine hydrolase [Vicinamibacterales bacterium]
MPRLVPVLACVLAAGVAVIAQGPLQDALRDTFSRQVEAVATHLDGVAGYIVTDLTDGTTVAAHLEQEAFPTASTIKLALLYELLKQSEEGRLTLVDRQPLDRAAVVGGSGVLQHLESPALTLRDYAALMIIVSDNTATNVVIDAVGMDQVNARMQGLGFGDVRLRRKMMDGAAAARGDENVASPASLAALVTRLWKGAGLTGASRQAALDILREVPGQIRSAVPARVPVYSKTGSLGGVRAEAAVVEREGRPFALAVMTTYLADDQAGERAIHDIAAAAFAYFDRLARGGKYGRQG